MAESTTPKRQPPPGSLRTADLLGALSLAADLAVGLSEEHALRASYIGIHVGRVLELPSDTLTDLYYAGLLMDAGCTAWTSPLAEYIKGDEIPARRDLYLNAMHADTRESRTAFVWLLKYMAPGAPLHVRAMSIMDFMRHGDAFLNEAFQNTSEVGLRMATRLGMSRGVQAAMGDIFERWDGKGPKKLSGTDIPVVARVLYMTGLLESIHRLSGRESADQLAKDRRGKAFDPSAVDAFLSVAQDEEFWLGLEREVVWDAMLAMEPDSQYRHLSLERLPDVALSFADFADMKSRYMRGRSRRVAEMAVDMARRMSLSEQDVTTIRVAALMHDLGLVAVPSFILEKPTAKVTSAEWEQVRLHPYNAQRILSKVPVLETVASIVGAHHERMDGEGYPRGLKGSEIPQGARIIAAADRFDELCSETPDHQAMQPKEAVELMSREVGSALDPEAFGALVDGLEGITLSRRSRVQRRQWPMGLTDREVDVLRLVAKGLSRGQMAGQLVVSESTVRSHLEHIYGKLGVSSRATATMFAMEHALL